MNTRELWDFLEERRGGYRFDIEDVEFFDDISSKISLLSIDEQKDVLDALARRFSKFTPSVFAIDNNYLDLTIALIQSQNNDLNSVLFLHPDFGSFSNGIIDKLNLSSIDLVTESKVLSNLHNKLCKKVNVCHGMPILHVCNDQRNKYNLIFGFPPLNMPTRKEVWSNDYPLFFKYEHILIIESAKILNQKGQGFFVISPAILDNKKRFLGFAARLHEAGACIKSIISLPNGFYSHTQVSPLLIIIEKSKPSLVFVTIYPENKLFNIVLENYSNQINGSFIKQGKWLELEQVRSFRALTSKETLDTVGSRLNFYKYTLGDVVKISKVKKDIGNNSEASEKVFYSHRSTVTVKKHALKDIKDIERKDNYFKLEVISEKIDIKYLMLYFQYSPNYKIALNEYATGSSVPYISFDNLKKVKIFAPSLKLQKEIVKSHGKVNNLKKELQNISEKLWTKEETVNDCLNDLSKGFPGRKIEIWINELHFPLAAILWKVYITPESDTLGRVSRMIHFYEALIEYLAIIQLSAYKNTSPLCDEALDSVFKELNTNNLTLRKSTIGSWLTVFEMLAKKTRKMVDSSDSDDNTWARAIFKTENDKLIRSLVDKRFVSIIREVIQIRNIYEGHSGEKNIEKAQQNYQKMQEGLDSVISIIEYICDNYSLIKGISSKKKNGRWLDTYEKVHGPNCEFKTYELESYEGLDTDCLTLLNNQTNESIPLIPLVLVENGPKTSVPTCYFFNRIQKNGESRFVSYDFGEDPEYKIENLDINNITNNNIC